MDHKGRINVIRSGAEDDAVCYGAREAPFVVLHEERRTQNWSRAMTNWETNARTGC